MKNIYYLFIFIAIIKLSYAQSPNSDCGKTIDCSNIKTAHKYCKNGKISYNVNFSLSINDKSGQNFSSFIFKDKIVLPYQEDKNNNKASTKLEIYNSVGNLILRLHEINNFLNEDFIIINSLNLSSGLYFFKILNGNKSKLYKVIIRR